VFEDFEKPTYEGWTVTGTAFSSGPIAADKIPSYQKIGQPHGKQLVNTQMPAREKTSRRRTLTWER
jgi:hypothetical protein